MTAVATAIIGSSLIGAAGSKSSANAMVKGQREGLAASQVMSNRAIGQAKDYFNIGRASSQAGFQSALDYFKAAQPAKYQPMIQGNVAAQRVIGQGAQQANNAILGLPVDMSFANQPQAFSPDYSAIRGAQLPKLGVGMQGEYQPSSPEQYAAENYIPGNYIEGLGRVTSVTDTGVSQPPTTITDGNWNGLGVRKS